MSGQTLMSCRQAIVDGITTALKAPLALSTCEVHRGRLSAQELGRLGARANAVLVGCLGWQSLEELAGELEADLQWIAWVVTKDAPNSPRGDAAMVIANALGALIVGNHWGLDAAQRPSQVSASNLYAQEIDLKGLSLWAVSWRQKMSIDQGQDIAALAEFVTWHAEHYNPGGIAAGATPLATDEVSNV